jgi:hypothetical protein
VVMRARRSAPPSLRPLDVARGRAEPTLATMERREDGAPGFYGTRGFVVDAMGRLNWCGWVGCG